MPMWTKGMFFYKNQIIYTFMSASILLILKTHLIKTVKIIIQFLSHCQHNATKIQVLQVMATIEITVMVCADCNKQLSKPIIETR